MASRIVQYFADKLKTVKDYPITLTKAVYDENGNRLDNKLQEIESNVSQLDTNLTMYQSLDGTLLLDKTSIATKSRDDTNKTYKLLDSINNYDEIIIYAHVGNITSNRDVCTVYKLPVNFFADTILNIFGIGGALSMDYIDFYCANISINEDTVTRYNHAFSTWGSLYIEIYGKKFE